MYARHRTGIMSAAASSVTQLTRLCDSIPIDGVRQTSQAVAAKVSPHTISLHSLSRQRSSLSLKEAAGTHDGHTLIHYPLPHT